MVCAELCGIGHSTMRQTVDVVSPAKFDAWVDRQQRSDEDGGVAAADGDAEAAGRQLFTDTGCAGCHTLADADATGTVGPELDDLAAQAAKYGKEEGQTPEQYVRTAILDPNAFVVPGFQPDVMPGGYGDQLSDAEIDTARPVPSGRERRRGLEMTLAAKLRAPGWYRVAVSLPLGLRASRSGSSALIRWAYGWDAVVDWHAITTVATDRDAARVPRRRSAASTTGSTGRSGKPTVPEDHSSHGAHTWKDYFQVNTDHKVIGIQYIVTTFVFFILGGLMAMLIRAELAQPGTQFVDPNTFNGLFSVHASLMIFLFIIPVFAGIANYVVPLMIGAPDMAFPRLNALSFWMLPTAGVMMVASFFVEGGAFATGWTAYAPLSTETPLGQQFFTIGVQFAGASSIATALNFLVTIITMRAPGMTFWRMPLMVWAQLHDLAAGRDRDAVHRRLAVLRPVRPLARDGLLQRRRRRRRADVPARLLVLLAPGRLHHDAAGLRDRQRGHLDARPKTRLRLPDDGLLAGRDRHPRLHRLGAPHVRLGHVLVAARADDDHDDADRRPDRREDLQLARDAVARA